MTYTYDDGGRADARYKRRTAQDCVCRAVSIASFRPYPEVHYEIDRFCREIHDTISSAEDGLKKETTRAYIASLGWSWVPIVGSKIHLTELPRGIIIAEVHDHVIAIIDGVVHDTTKRRYSVVYGYWSKG